ncbi:MAG: hypothetical protein MJB57_05400 [Gemmatimonadetes bacterium]|nr:hypothetical protein [Gemmatimonadota bacterium]
MCGLPWVVPVGAIVVHLEVIRHVRIQPEPVAPRDLLHRGAVDVVRDDVRESADLVEDHAEMREVNGIAASEALSDDPLAERWERDVKAGDEVWIVGHVVRLFQRV